MAMGDFVVTVVDGLAASQRRRPDWRGDDGHPVPDSVLIDAGLYPVEDAEPAFDPTRRRLFRRPEADWIVQADRVTVTYELTDLTTAEISARLAGAVRVHLDTVVKTRGYDGLASCVSYLGSSNPVWAAEARAASDWRDAVWAAAYQLLAEVEAGETPMPTDGAFIASLPAISWPA